MGGQTSRMLREAAQDSLYILRQTNKSTYQESVNARHELESKLQDLRAVRKEMFESAAQDETRAEVFKQFESVTSQKKALDEQLDGFANQFALPKQFQSIADQHAQDMKKLKAEQRQKNADNAA